jgi:hypothetical protein
MSAKELKMLEQKRKEMRIKRNHVEEEDEEPEEAKPDYKGQLRDKIIQWIDLDDLIKEKNSELRELKSLKKNQETRILLLIDKHGLDDKKFDMKDRFNCRVFQSKTVSKGAIKETIIKDALMEAIHDENKVEQLIKKIESKRPLNEKICLKKAKGENKKK